MSDLISRKDVFHELDWCDYGLKDWQKWKLKMMVRDIPSAEPERRWIPCKLLDHYYIKELKDCDNKSYLVTYKTKTGRRYVKKVNIYHGKIQSKVGGKVIAWMPLPEAYEESEE